MMFYRLKFRNILLFGTLIFSVLQANEVQLVSTHRKSNGTLLRVVTSNIVDIDNIAGWVGQENWFYITLNGISLGESSMDYIDYELPIIDLEVTENNESVQLGYLFNRPIEDFEIFHSKASRVLLIQVWESLNHSLRSEVISSETQNKHKVFTLPKEESKGSPFYDSFIYARNKYGPEKYFVWYNDWYSTEDDEVEDDSIEIPKPLIVQKKKNEPLPVLVSSPKKYKKSEIDISWILDKGMLDAGIRRPEEVKELQRALIALGYDLGVDGVYNNGVDGDFGPATESAVMNFQSDRGFNGVDVDGIIGQGTHRELTRALENKKIKISKTEKTKNPKTSIKVEPESFVYSELVYVPETAEEVLARKPVKADVKREIRKLDNQEQLDYLPPDLSKRKTFLKLSSNVKGADVFIDGTLVGKTPIPKKIVVKPGWHRIRVVDSNAPPPKFAMKVPDYQDIYVTKGRTQKIRINLSVSEQESSE